MFIKKIEVKLIKNSRKEGSVEIFVETYEGRFSASAPSGKSKGKYEVKSYNERGLVRSFRLMEVLAKKMKHQNILIKNFSDLEKFEKVVRGFERKYGMLGGNFVYALESCLLKAAAKAKGVELWEFVCGNRKKIKMPMPVGNCVGGGLHSKKVKGKKQDFQEFLLIPKEKTFSRAVTKNFYAYEFAKKLIKKKERKWRIQRNDEGAWQTGLTNEEVLEILAIVGKKYGVRIGLDVAASSFCDKRGYYNYENKKLVRDRQEQIDYIRKLVEKYNLIYVEDPLQEDDFAGFTQLIGVINPQRTMIVGDDLTVTNLNRVKRAVGSGAVNAIIVKPNQIGSLVEVGKVAEFCREKKIKMIFSHRSGETIDDALADYCVGFGGNFLKAGIYGRERLIKLGELWRLRRV